MVISWWKTKIIVPLLSWKEDINNSHQSIWNWLIARYQLTWQLSRTMLLILTIIERGSKPLRRSCCWKPIYHFENCFNNTFNGTKSKRLCNARNGSFNFVFWSLTIITIEQQTQVKIGVGSLLNNVTRLGQKLANFEGFISIWLNLEPTLAIS